MSGEASFDRDLAELRLAMDPGHRTVRRVSGFIAALAFGGLAPQATIQGPVRITLTVSRPQPSKGRYRVEGEVVACVVQSCARCLEAFGVTATLLLDRWLIPGVDPARESASRAGSPHGRREPEFLDESEMVDYIPDGFISVRPMVEEEILLSLPMVPLCRDDCAGLCPACGAERNREACRCTAQGPDSRHAAAHRP